MKNKKTPLMLLILDGYGISSSEYGNAVKLAKTPYIDTLTNMYPNTQLGASGLDVGLPEGQMGNSEVGHLNIGAGRVVYQDLTKIDKAISEKTLLENHSILKAINHTKENHSNLHLMGLLSDGGVHSHITHIFGLLDMAKKEGVPNTVVHCFLDGRDVPPKSAETYIKDLEAYMDKINYGKIASLSGRYYAMDRDNRWDRIALAYNALTTGQGIQASKALDAIAAAYANGETDEFVKPTVLLDSKEKPVALIEDGDSIISFNFRPDRMRELTRAFVDADFKGFERNKIIKNLTYITMTQYDATMPNVEVAFPKDPLKNTLGEYLSYKGLTQLRIAETEKYAHVTFFFNGGVEAPNSGEDRVLIQSPKVATYDLQPEMSALKVTDQVIDLIKKEQYDIIILNFANPDMVGHSGILEATISALEDLDDCVRRITDSILDHKGTMLLISDHGNSECMLEPDGSPMTAHTTNPVPCILVSSKPLALRDKGRLSDVAPTLLDLLNLPVPKEMTGETLIIK